MHKKIFLLFSAVFIAVIVEAQPKPRTPTPTPQATATPDPATAITLLSMTPEAESLPADKTPPRQFLFRFRGKKGTSYVAVFSAPAEPAMVVGVGADISSTSYDETTQQLTVNFLFDLSVINEDGKSRDPNEFIIVLDPGAEKQFSPMPRPSPGFPPPPKPKARSLSALADSTDECYGPANKNTPSPDQNGPPLQARGTWMSTNIASWCVIPPNETNPFFGFKLVAPPGTKGFFRKKLPANLLNLLSLLAGKTLDPDSLAIFNGTFEASKSISSTSDGGALVNIQLGFSSTTNSLTDKSSSSSSNRIQAASSTTTKTVTVAEEEAISLTPKTSTITKNKASLFGFVADSTSLAGQTVSIQRKVGKTFKTIATTTVASDGSYSKKVTSSKLFNTKSSATIQAIVGNAISTSRTTSLKNKSSSLRR